VKVAKEKERRPFAKKGGSGLKFQVLTEMSEKSGRLTTVKGLGRGKKGKNWTRGEREPTASWEGGRLAGGGWDDVEISPRNRRRLGLTYKVAREAAYGRGSKTVTKLAHRVGSRGRFINGDNLRRGEAGEGGSLGGIEPAEGKTGYRK